MKVLNVAVTLEALASGIPVIATNIGETPLLLENAQDVSTIVEPRSAPALAQACLAMLRNTLDRTEACRNFASGFSWESMAAQVTALVEEHP